MKKGIRLLVSNDIGPGEAGWQVSGCAPKNLRKNCEGISRRFSKFWSRILTDEGSVASESVAFQPPPGDNAGDGGIE